MGNTSRNLYLQFAKILEKYLYVFQVFVLRFKQYKIV